MKEKVTAFLGNLPKAGSDQFNKALELYRKSKNHSVSQVRFMNEQGYSASRLEILLYELKKLHNITDLEVAKARNKKKVEKEEITEDYPNQAFSKTVMEFDTEHKSEEEITQLAQDIREFFGVEKSDSGISDPDLIRNFQDFLKAELKANAKGFPQLLEDLKSSLKVQLSNPGDIVSGDGKVILPKTPSADLSDNGPEDFEPSQNTVPSKEEFEQAIVKLDVDSLKDEELEIVADHFCELYNQERHYKDENGDVPAKQIVQNAKEYFLRVAAANTEGNSANTEAEDKEKTLSSRELDAAKEENSQDAVEQKMTSEEIDAQAKGAAAEKEKFLKQDLADFDVEAHKYNGIKSFAADLSDYINEDPKDQKAETLKAFILDAKKKYLES